MYIYNAPNGNWHIYDQLGDGWGYMYAGGYTCPYDSDDTRLDL